MTSTLTQSKGSFFKTHILPVLLVFLIPGFSAWFFTYAEGWMDQIMRDQLQSVIRSDRSIPESEQSQIVDFYLKVPVSKIMASNRPEAAKMQASFSSVKIRYATFRWMKRIAWICLATVIVTFIIVGLSTAFAMRSQAALYTALRIGWPVLRTSAAIQVTGQAVLAVALSFWVTAIATERYFLKLILIVGILAVCAVWALLKAIFAKTDERCEVNGEMIGASEAPALWDRVVGMAAHLGTAAPDRIVVGIEPSFFVTEHPVVLGTQVLHGRTLYLSLPMLKVLAADETDAVLGHELAHFSGGDTLWSRRISPITTKFALYLRTLGEGLSVLVANFMLLFWKLYGLSINRLSRAREFLADKVGAEMVSAEAMKRALVKITCYCEYRAAAEQGVFAQQRLNPDLNLPLQLEQGYPAFLSAFAESKTAINERVPHPFDSHPTLSNRLENLGFEAHTAVHDESIQQISADSWYWAISSAPALEERMWGERQAMFQEAHGQLLAWTLHPQDAEQVAIVTALFPPVAFRRKDGAQATISFDRILLPECIAPILFKDLLVATTDEHWMKKRLILTHREAGKAKPTTTKFYPASFTGEAGDFLTTFNRYFVRHRNADAAAL